MRYKFVIEYDGTGFIGWQAQRFCKAHQKGVQTVLEEAAYKLCGQQIRFHAAGRTDTGVHAWGQVAHADIVKSFPPSILQRALNALVRPFPVAVVHVERIDNSFHARFSAQMRHYCYRILNRATPSPLHHHRVWVVGVPLCIEAMQEGGQFLLGHHDFTTFRAAACQAHSPQRTLTTLNIHTNDATIDFHISAPSFLHHQIRSIIGSLKKVGEGTWPPTMIRDILRARNRALCAPLAPPYGLYFSHVDYNL